MKAIVTGGAGFIGSHLVDSLLRDGYEVTVIDNLERGSAQNLRHCLDGITFIHADLRERLPSLGLTDINTVVFDLAAKVFGVTYLYQTPWTLMSDNLQITMNNLKRWGQAKKYVYLSSSCVYDFEGAPIPHKESDVGFLNSFYGWSKCFGELCCQALDEEWKQHGGFNYTVIRPFNVYGPREAFLHPHVLPDFIRKACACKYDGVQTFEILGDGNQTRSLTYVDDVVDGIRLAAEVGKRTAYNLSYPKETRIIDLARLLWELMEIDPEPVFVAAPEKEVKLRCGSSEKAERELGWRPKIELREGLMRMLEWMVPLIEPKARETL